MEGRAADVYASSGATHEEMATWFYNERANRPTLDQVIVEYHTGHLHIARRPRGEARGQFLYTLDGKSYHEWQPT